MLASDILHNVNQIHIRARRLVDGAFAGQHESVFKGRGIEFAEVREYAPGDDVRTIDWNVTARLGAPYVKQYVEEREMTVMLLVDLSASGVFATQKKLKREVVTELAAILSLAAVKNNDRVGLILFSDRLEKVIPPRKGKHRTQRVVHELLTFKPTGLGTDIGLALEHLQGTTRTRTLTFVISDFLSEGYERALRIAHQRHEVVPICVFDEREHELPAVGLLRVFDLETGATRTIDTDDSTVRENHRRSAEQAREKRNALFHALGMRALEVRTGEDLAGPLARHFRRHGALA